MRKRQPVKYTISFYKTIIGRKNKIIKKQEKISACYFNSGLKLFQFKSDDPRFKYCSIKYKYHIEVVKEAEKEVIKEKSKKKKILSWIFLGVNVVVIALILLFQMNSGDVISLVDLFSIEAKWGYLALAFLMMLLAIGLDMFKSIHLIYVSTRRIRPFLSFKTTMYGRYYDSITPLSSGGEPFQIFYLKKRGLRGEVATSIPIVKSLLWQISMVVVAIIVLVTNAGAYSGSNVVVVSIAWISIACSCFMLLMIFTLSISKKIGPRIVIGILKLLSKLRIVKNYQLTYRKVMRFVFSYQGCMRTFASNISTVFIQLVLSFADILITTMIPYFIYLTFVIPPVEPATVIIAKIIMCNMVSLIIPIPGGSGAAELSFTAMFASLFTNGTLFWAMLIWRIITYYFIIISGLCLTFYDFIIGNAKADRLVKMGYFRERIHFVKHKRKNKMQKMLDDSPSQIDEEQ